MVRAADQQIVREDALNPINDLVVETTRFKKHEVLRRNFSKYFTTVFKDNKGNQIKLKSFHREIAILLRNNPRILINVFRGSGKALALDTPIATPSGWTTMGDLQVGDWVFDEEGKPCGL